MGMSEPISLPSPVLIIGVRGFLGAHLARHLAESGVAVRGTTRSADTRTPPAGVKHLFSWNGEDSEALVPLLNGAEAVINLAGTPLKTTPWTRRYQERIRESRIRSAAALMTALSGRRKTVRVLQASAVGFYGDTRDNWVSENSPPGHGFLARLVTDWEAAAGALRPSRISLALIRTGVVLHSSGGALKRLRQIQRPGVTPMPGGGNQWLSWIHLEDYLRALSFLLSRPDITGPFNLCAPQPVRFAAFSTLASRKAKRTIAIRVPAGLVRFFLGVAAEPLLVGQRARPAKLEDAGFRFKHPELDPRMQF